MKTMHRFLLASLIVFGLILNALALTGCGGEDDDDCAVTESCGGPDAGATADDADPSDSDANVAPDANDPCAEYAEFEGTLWFCRGGGGIPFDSTLDPVATGDICTIHTEDFWCENTTPVSALLIGWFTCTDIGTQATIACSAY